MRRRKVMQIKNPLQSLFSAIERDDREKILALAVLYQDIINQKNRQGLTPLMDAVISRKYEIMRLLLLHGAIANIRDHDGWTAYSWAIFIQDKEAQKILSKASRYNVVSHSDDISGAIFGSMIV